MEQVTQISKDLHVMAQTTGITVCALSQLSRPQKGGENEKAPGLHSLRQSGQIEQDADGVLLLYKEEPNNPRSRRCLKIAKNKDGEAGGIVYLVFDGAHQRFKPSVVDKPCLLYTSSGRLAMLSPETTSSKMWKMVRSIRRARSNRAVRWRSRVSPPPLASASRSARDFLR